MRMSLQRCADDTCLKYEGNVTPPNALQDLATADFNEDGIQDVVAAGDELRVFFGGDRPTGLVQSDSRLLSTTQRFSVIVGDFNGDGHNVIGAANLTSYEQYYGNGSGGFGTPIPIATFSQAGIAGLGTGDINGDGKPDAVINRFDGGDNPPSTLRTVLYVYANQQLLFSSVSPPLHEIAVGDIDGDGRADIAGTPLFYNVIRLLRSTGTGLTGFGTAGAFTSLAVGKTIHTIDLRDIDRDGKVDVFASEFTQVSWWNGLGDGTFRPRTDRALPDATSFAFGYDNGSPLPNLVVSQGQPDGRVAFLANRSF
jgi:hypothetical protein